MKTTIGILMLAAMYLPMFYLVARRIGWKNSIYSALVGAALLGWMIAALSLIEPGS